MPVFQTRSLAVASASHARTMLQVVPSESGVPIVPVDSLLRTYVMSGTPSPFGYRITVNGSVVDEGIVPVAVGFVSGFVYFFGPTIETYGRLRVTMSMIGDRRVFLQVGCWRKVSDAESDNDTGGLPVYCAGTVYRDRVAVSAEDTECLTFPAPFVGSVELFLV